ncbi:hypothetical protein EYF80_009706 [Liparis tanakae]|uniref:Uncharacterized protein n=1 Tax=Liparis tanakae TaxID=230148 RepID=A0A4Z2IQ68_9TELE|nr:hypothetical protein EYF80_009706 [Liparis tanakae]
MSVDSTAGREPSLIHFAKCKNCTVKHMISKPIFIQVSVYHMIRNGNDPTWCQCPFNLAVGCTCVKHQHKS